MRCQRESQHITHYGSMFNPDESPLEKLMLHEASEVWAYQACAEQETNPRLKALWERFLDYELGHLQVAKELLQRFEGRDPAEVLGDGAVPSTIQFKPQRDFIRQTLVEVPMRKDGTQFVGQDQEPASSIEYRNQLNAPGSPSNSVSGGYRWTPDTELSRAA